MNQDELIHGFVRLNANRGTASNMFIDGDVLYSYGYHFPLLVKHPSGYLILNADRFSRTTNKHQNLCFRHADILIPFSMLRPIRTKLYDPTLSEIILIQRTDARWDLLGYSLSEEGKQYDLPERLTPSEYNSLKHEDDKAFYWKVEERRPESLLFRIARRYYLSSMDGQQYFLAQLSSPCRKISTTFELLKPKHLRGCKENFDYTRQGEWFFVDVTALLPEQYRYCKAAKHRLYQTFPKNYPLPYDPGSNIHLATRGIEAGYLFGRKLPTYIKRSTPLVCGQIRHPEHPMKRLSTLQDIKFFAAYKNTAKMSWSRSGGID